MQQGLNESSAARAAVSSDSCSGDGRVAAVPDDRYRAIFETTGTATVLLEDDMTISMVNGEFEKISGYRREAVEGRVRWNELMAEEDVERVMAYHRLRRHHPDQAPRNYECRVRLAGGAVHPCQLTVAMIPGTRQSVASVVDLWEVRKLERLVVQIAEKERQRIGRTLHDDLGAHLVGVEAMTTLLERRLCRDRHPQAEMAGDITGLIRDAIAKTRRLAHGLLPVEMDDRALVAALGNLARDFDRMVPAAVIFEAAGDIRVRDNTTATHLYYIAREAVNNAITHGGAGRIVIKLEKQARKLALIIADDGCGIGRGRESTGKGVGLDIMHYRANAIGADLAIGPQDPDGTIVECILRRKY